MVGFFKETHCNRGHAWTDSNSYSYLTSTGNHYRKCKKCTQDRNGIRKKITEQFPLSKPSHPDKIAQTPDYCQAEQAHNAIRVNLLLDLHEKLERETRAWIRKEIQADIRAASESRPKG